VKSSPALRSGTHCFSFVVYFPMLLYAKSLISFCLVYSKFPFILFICACLLDCPSPLSSPPLLYSPRGSLQLSCGAQGSIRDALPAHSLRGSQAGMNSRQISVPSAVCQQPSLSTFLHPNELILFDLTLWSERSSCQ
jgi:hypothetical protein